MKINKQIILSILFSTISTLAYTQCSAWNDLQAIDSIFTNPAFGISTSPEIDKLNRPFTYLATVSGGVKIYDINTFGNSTIVATVPKSELGNLDAINLFQDSIWLYVSLGNIWDTTEMAGLAIIDVSNPSSPDVLDFYIHPGLGGGSGAVITRGDFAYLAANKNGLVILNISNRINIQFTSALTLFNNYPHTAAGSNSLYNARGIGLNENHAYVCYDRGGLRIIDISDVNIPVQINQYCFLPLIDKSTAYNNIAIHNNLAFVAIDYYGMEVLDISNPHSITQIGWWHPITWADTTNNYITWANSVGHANEIVYDSACQMIYLSAGKSDAVAIDVSVSSNPVTCETYGSTTDTYGTWGIDFFDGKISIAYIWSVALPPYSNYTGFKILQTKCNTTELIENINASSLTLYPNPSSNLVKVNIPNHNLKFIRLFKYTGALIQEYFTPEFSIQNLPSGFYFMVTQTDQSTFINKLIKE